VALVAVAAYVGHSGGRLVYEYGAASAYTGSSARVSATVPRRGADEGDDR
jgi:hypothetical protein